MIPQQKLRVVVFILTLIVLLPSMDVLSQDAAMDFSLMGPPSIVEVDPGDLATLVFRLTNLSDATRTYELALETPTGIMLLAPLSDFTLDPGEDETIFVTVVIGREVPSGLAQIVLTASPTDGSSGPMEAVGELRITGAAELEITPPPDRVVEPGDFVELTFVLVNQGNAPDRYSLLANSNQNLEISVPFEEIELLVGEEREVTLAVSVPNTAQAGIVRVRLTARSLSLDRETFATARLEILPPLPSAVGGSLFYTLPTTLTLSFSGDPGGPLTISEVISAQATLSNGGTLAFRFSFTDLIHLERFRIDLDYAQFGASIGDLALALSPLFSFTGRGGSITVRSPDPEEPSTGSLGLLLPSGDEGPTLGGRVETSLMGLTPLLGLRIRPTVAEILGGAGIEGPIGQAGSFNLSSTFSRDETTSLDHAFVISQSVTLGSLTIRSSLLRAGPEFLGSRQDLLSLNFDQILSTSGISVQGRYTFARNNVSNDPDIVTLLNTGVSAGLRIPFTNTTLFASQLDFSSQRNPEPVTDTDVREFALSTRLTQTLGLLTLSAIHERERTSDFIAGTDIESVAWRSITDLQIERFSTQIRLGLIQERNLIADATISSLFETSITGRLNLSVATLALTVERLPEITKLTGSISSDLGQLSLTSRKSLAISDTGDLDFSFSVSVTARFGLPIPFVRVLGRIEGFIYLDENANGQRDANEPGISDATVDLNGSLVRTDESGFFRSQPLGAGEVALRLTGLPEGLLPPSDDPIIFELARGEILRVAIPVEQVGFVRGSVFNDVNENGQLDSGERGLPNILIRLSGREEREARTSPDGQFSLQVPPGEYEVSVDASTLPDRFELTTTSPVNVIVERGRIASVQFGAAEVIDLRFAPLAEFSYTPEQISVGDVVTFNGTLSQDTDGEIVSYEWDFDGDDIIDATGAITSTTYTEPGEYAVRLIVTDDDGQQDSSTQTLVVLQAGE